jgi:hypothetical protein
MRVPPLLAPYEEDARDPAIATSACYKLIHINTPAQGLMDLKALEWARATAAVIGINFSSQIVQTFALCGGIV